MRMERLVFSPTERLPASSKEFQPLRTLLRIGILLVPLLGCTEQTSPSVQSAPYQQWRSYNLHDYTFDQVRTCYCAENGQTVRITVRSDTVALVTRLSDDSTIPPPASTAYLTVDSLFGIIRNPGTDSLVVEYDSTHGYPKKLDVNPRQHQEDGGVLIENSNLQIDTIANECVCTALFAFYNVTVIDTTGAPVTGLHPIVTVVRTGRDISSSLTPAGNQYPVFSDGEIHLIDPAGELIRFTAGNAQGAATGDFVFDAPGACHCHIHKVSGPDTLVIRAGG